jgi:hypothetical protein
MVSAMRSCVTVATLLDFDEKSNPRLKHPKTITELSGINHPHGFGRDKLQPLKPTAESERRRNNGLNLVLLLFSKVLPTGRGCDKLNIAKNTFIFALASMT